MTQLARGATAALPVMGSLLAAKGVTQSGASQYRAADFEARQMEQAAGGVEAASQNEAVNRLRENQLLQSRALAVAGASGAGVTDPTVLKLISNLAATGKYNAEMEMFGGKEQARSLRTQAAATRYQGAEVVKASKTTAAATVLSGVGQGAANWFGAGRFWNQPGFATA